MMQSLIVATILFPLLGALIVGIANKRFSYKIAHWVTTICVFIAFVLSCYLFNLVIFKGQTYYGNAYVWGISGDFQFNIGFMLDSLTACMLIVVTFVSLLVHIYSIGYMKGDLGYQRFFSYISLFTFAMLLLVTANNFLQLFIGWEGVGLVSYLLIGFWYDKESANFGALKAFIVNRVGDIGFILGIAATMMYFGTVDYSSVFNQAQNVSTTAAPLIIFVGHPWSAVTVICILLFIGAMGKSAQMPLHVWLPESMEGPTPISALIHAATMVTAGVFMVARMSPLFELSPTALSVILIIGATTALFTGILGTVQHDIKRVVAYSTLSQLGYMTAALGASAFAASIFHLITHAAFKALLFLAAGAVIMAMHHEQDMRKMGGLKKHLPFTYAMFLIGALSLSAIPPFSGFYSKDAIIEAVHGTTLFGSSYAYIALLLGAFITAFYIFRALFLTFHTQERMSAEIREHIKEPGWVVWLPLLLLAIPAIIIGAILAKPLLYSQNAFWGSSLHVALQYDTLISQANEYHNWFAAFLHAFISLPFWFAVAGIFSAWLCCVKFPAIRTAFATRCSILYKILIAKYGFDDFNQWFFVRGTRNLSEWLFKYIDMDLIDHGIVDGSGRLVEACSRLLKRFQSGYIYHYVLAMIVALLAFLIWTLLT